MTQQSMECKLNLRNGMSNLLEVLYDKTKDYDDGSRFNLEHLFCALKYNYVVIDKDLISINIKNVDIDRIDVDELLGELVPFVQPSDRKTYDFYVDGKLHIGQFYNGIFELAESGLFFPSNYRGR